MSARAVLPPCWRQRRRVRIQGTRLARSKTGARAAEVNKLAALAWPQVIEKTAADTAGLSIVEERLLYEPADRR